MLFVIWQVYLIGLKVESWEMIRTPKSGLGKPALCGVNWASDDWMSGRWRGSEEVRMVGVGTS